ncbi:MAG: hypothetical protein IOMNBAOH_00700 [Rhodocyclaceae bacterium]|nr:hypothetical protein [Rhodocyclaceae bacterium]
MEIPSVNALSTLSKDDSTGRAIGAILIDAGRLKPDDAERILRAQSERGMLFGDAAKSLGLLTDQDVEFALSRQFDYPYLRQGESRLSEELVAAYTPFSAPVEALRSLRSQLLLRWFDPGRRMLAIVSPERGEGRSWLAANLAIVFSQLGEKTLLIDADLRNPRQHQLFGVDNTIGLSAALSGRGGPESAQRIPALRDLSVLPAGAKPPNPVELLSRPSFSSLLDSLSRDFDVIIIDSAAANEHADAQTIAARAGGAVLLAEQNRSRASSLRALADTLTQSGSVLVGTVINQH